MIGVFVAALFIGNSFAESDDVEISTDYYDVLNMQIFRIKNKLPHGGGDHSLFMGYSNVETAVGAMYELLAAYSSDSLSRWNETSKYILGEGMLKYEDHPPHISLLELARTSNELGYTAEFSDGRSVTITFADLSGLGKLSLNAQLGIFLSTTFTDYFDDLERLYTDFEPDYIRGEGKSAISAYQYDTFDAPPGSQVILAELAFQCGIYDTSCLRLDHLGEVDKISGRTKKVDTHKYLITIPDSVMMEPDVPDVFNDTIFKIPYHRSLFWES